MLVLLLFFLFSPSAYFEIVIIIVATEEKLVRVQSVFHNPSPIIRCASNERNYDDDYFIIPRGRIMTKKMKSIRGSLLAKVSLLLVYRCNLNANLPELRGFRKANRYFIRIKMHF